MVMTISMNDTRKLNRGIFFLLVWSILRRAPEGIKVSKHNILSQVSKSFVSELYTLLNGLTYNTGGYFASCVGEEKYGQRAKCPHVLYVKPFNNGFIIQLLCHFLVFYLLPAWTETRIDCGIII